MFCWMVFVLVYIVCWGVYCNNGVFRDILEEVVLLEVFSVIGFVGVFVDFKDRVFWCSGFLRFTVFIVIDFVDVVFGFFSDTFFEFSWFFSCIFFIDFWGIEIIINFFLFWGFVCCTIIFCWFLFIY